MKLALFVVAIIGIVIGLSVPVSRPAPAIAALRAPGDAPVDTVLERSPSGHFITFAEINDEPVRFVVDTGADTVALTLEDAKRAHVAFDPAQFQVIGKGASGDVRGQEVRIANIVLDGKRATDVRAVVLEGSDMSLLGHTYLRKLASVEIKNDQMTLR